jgi:hypothetical protein
LSHRGSESGFDPPRSGLEAEPLLLKKIQLKENIASDSSTSFRKEIGFLAG